MISSPINLLLTTKKFEEDNYQLIYYHSKQYEKKYFINKKIKIKLYVINKIIKNV